ncbi:MAG: hypothetical protein ACIPMY_06115, partial [Rickettsia endosymbiont of Pentastiridius leporinus]
PTTISSIALLRHTHKIYDRLKTVLNCAVGIMGTLTAIKLGEACYNYYMEPNTQEGLIGEVEGYNTEIQ